jgi:probable phosphoglycerate mutase
MSDHLPSVYLARHGETAWTISHQHTGLTDLPLTERGERNARSLGQRLKSIDFTRVFTSPLERAKRTCELAGFGDRAEIDRDLVEWNYGEYEGKTTAEIRKARPEWNLFNDGCPGGESLEQIGERADRVIATLKKIDGDVLVFSSGDLLRVLAARWLGLGTEGGKHFFLSTAALSIVSYNHTPEEPVIKLWNSTDHVTS